MSKVEIVLSSLAGLAALALWLLKRYQGVGPKIAKLKGQVDEITKEIVAELQKRPVDTVRVHRLNVQRDDLSREIARLSGSGA